LLKTIPAGNHAAIAALTLGKEAKDDPEQRSEISKE
jgi:hypothetical protein